MSAPSGSARPRLSSIDRSQLVFRTVDVERMIDDDHSARSIWEMVGRRDLSLYVAKIAAVEGRAGRDHTAPQLLISLWLYAYSQGVSSAREIARGPKSQVPGRLARAVHSECGGCKECLHSDRLGNTTRWRRRRPARTPPSEAMAFMKLGARDGLCRA